MLGVRVPEDIQPDDRGTVRPECGGMSVAPDSIWNGPHHRRPREMKRGSTGKSEDRMYALAAASVSNALAVRPDPKAPERHVFLEPVFPMHILEYREALERTRLHWRQVWP